MNVSVYDAGGALVATNADPPFPFPTPDERRQAEAGLVQRTSGVVVNRVLRGGALIGYEVVTPAFPAPPLRGVIMDLAIISSWICLVGFLMWQDAGAAAAEDRPPPRARVSVKGTTGGAHPAWIGPTRSARWRARSTRCRSGSRSRARAERELLASMSHELRHARWRGSGWRWTWRPRVTPRPRARR